MFSLDESRSMPYLRLFISLLSDFGIMFSTCLLRNMNFTLFHVNPKNILYLRPNIQLASCNNCNNNIIILIMTQYTNIKIMLPDSSKQTASMSGARDMHCINAHRDVRTNYNYSGSVTKNW